MLLSPGTEAFLIFSPSFQSPRFWRSGIGEFCCISIIIVQVVKFRLSKERRSRISVDYSLVDQYCGGHPKDFSIFEESYLVQRDSNAINLVLKGRLFFLKKSNLNFCIKKN